MNLIRHEIKQLLSLMDKPDEWEFYSYSNSLRHRSNIYLSNYRTFRGIRLGFNNTHEYLTLDLSFFERVCIFGKVSKLSRAISEREKDKTYEKFVDFLMLEKEIQSQRRANREKDDK